MGRAREPASNPALFFWLDRRDLTLDGCRRSCCCQQQSSKRSREWGWSMRYVLALFLPWAVFFTMGKVGQGFLCLLLQVTIIGWLTAIVWAFLTIADYNADKRMDRLVIALTSTAHSTADPRRI